VVVVSPTFGNLTEIVAQTLMWQTRNTYLVVLLVGAMQVRIAEPFTEDLVNRTEEPYSHETAI
jgi:hypothetical protein